MEIPHAPEATRHAKLAWWKRNTDRNIDIQTAWREGVPAGAPNYTYDDARLHEPTGTLLLARDDTLTTVIYIDGIELEDEHLVECSGCGQRYEQTANMNESGCPWCEGPDPEVQAAAFEPLPA